jgi:hypothetical protein
MNPKKAIDKLEKLIFGEEDPGPFDTILINLDDPPSTWENNADIILPPDMPPFTPLDTESIDAATEWLETKYNLVGWFVDSDFYNRETPTAQNGTGFILCREPD